jgi:hypothetical protein
MNHASSKQYRTSSYVAGYYHGKAPDEIKKHILDEGFSPILITNSSGYEYHPHEHAATKLLAIVEGGMSVIIDDKTYTAKPASRIVISGNTMHAATIGKEGCVFFWAERKI